MTDNTSLRPAFNPPLYWLTWTLATAGGWLGGVLINFAVISLLGLGALSAELNTNAGQISQETALLLLVAQLVVLMILGGSIGVLQWLVLRRQVPNVGRWIPATAVGFAVGSFAYPVFFLGIGIGLLQWLVLRRDLNKTGWWPVLSAVAWPLAYLAGLTIGSLNSPFLEGLLSAFVTGAFAGGITGAIMLWLLRENRALLDGMRQELEKTPR